MCAACYNLWHAQGLPVMAAVLSLGFGHMAGGQEVQGGGDGLPPTAGGAGLAAAPALPWHCLQLCAAQRRFLHHAGGH